MSQQLKWSGSESPYLSEIKIEYFDQILIGRYGGNLEAGAYKNEDGALVWKGWDWEFAMILDGHNSSESVDLILTTFEKERSSISAILNECTNHTFKSIENHIQSIFQSDEFIKACQQVRGETACLITVRKENYLWWFSVGDCLTYVFHDEFKRLGQYALNQRQFYEWIGSVNTFSLSIPCYSSGVRELRLGRNVILMVTDGILECEGRYYEESENLFEEFQTRKLEESANHILQHVHDSKGRDSATLICWEYYSCSPGQYPSDQPKGGGDLDV